MLVRLTPTKSYQQLLHLRHVTRGFSVLQRPPPNYEGHVPLNTIERGVLAAGSALISLFNPRRAGMLLREEEKKATFSKNLYSYVY
jgi:hypothetical protein